jgi:predicted dehydrogenase
LEKKSSTFGYLVDVGVHHTALLRYVSDLEVIENKSHATQVADHLPPIDTTNSSVVFVMGLQGLFHFFCLS